MKTSQALAYAFRLNYSQIASEVNGPVRQIAKSDHTGLSAALLAAIGLGLSSFSVKQMVTKSTRKF